MPPTDAQLTTTFDGFRGTMIIADQNGIVQYVNKAIEDRTGFTVAEVVGRKAGALWGRQMSRSFYNELWHTIRDTQRPFVAPVTNKTKKRLAREESVHIAPICGKSQEVQYFIELQPDPHYSVSTVFEREFVRLFSTVESASVSTVAVWLGRALGRADAPPLERQYETLSDFFQSEFVLPAQAVFCRRNTDALLVEQAQRDPEAFQELYEKYQNQVRSYFSHRVAGDSEAAEDLTQETFIRAFRALPTFRSINARYDTYLLRIAHNLLVNQYRIFKPFVYDSAALSQLGEEPRCESDSDTNFDTYDLSLAMNVLSEIERQVIRMKYHDEMRIRDIAVVLDKSENAVKLHLSRARQKMKNALSLE